MLQAYSHCATGSGVVVDGLSNYVATDAWRIGETRSEAVGDAAKLDLCRRALGLRREGGRMWRSEVLHSGLEVAIRQAK